MAEEQNRVVKTYPDGVRATLTIDSSNGAILDYSIDNSNKQPNAAAAAVNLQPLEKRVAALEDAPKGAAEAFPRGNYDRSKYNRTVTEEEVENMLTDGTAPEHQGESEQAATLFPQLPEHLRAACCVYECPTAEKIVLKGGVEFVRLSNKEPLEIFCNTTTSEVFAFRDVRTESGEWIVVYPYNMVTKEMDFSPESPFVSSVRKSNYETFLKGGGYKTNILRILESGDPVRMLQEFGLAKVHVSSLADYFTADPHMEWKYEAFILETDSHDRYIRLNQEETRRLFGDEPCTVLKNIADGTLYKLKRESKQYDASDVELPVQDAKYFKAYVLGQIPGIPGTYTIREDFYADMRESMGMVVPVFPTPPKPLEPVADQIKKLLGLS